MAKNVVSNSKLRLKDEINIIGKDGTIELPMEKHFTRLIGEIQVINGLTGKPLFTFNDVILPGATYVLEKFFGKRSTFGMTTLSTDLSVKADIAVTQDNLKDEFVFGFVAGIGGSEPPDLIKAVKFKDKTVASIIPLRIVDIANDLSPTEQAKYAIKKTVGTKYYYYARRFDTDTPIRHLYTDGTEIPANVDQVDTNLGLLVYGESVFTVGANDIREYFLETYGNIDTCRFNSIGLVAGFIDGTDFAGVRVVTKANLPNLYLRDNESYYSFIYKVYAI